MRPGRSSSLRSLSLASLCLCLALNAPRSALAQDAGDAATAQALYDQARDLMKAGKYQPACKKLEESERLDPGVGTKFWLAECYENSYRLASAWTLYLNVASLAAAAGHESREQVAREKAAAVLLRMPRLTIEFDGDIPQGMKLTRNGRLIGDAQYGAPMPVDAGAHVLEVSAPGFNPLSLEIEIEVDVTEKKVIVPPLVPIGNENSDAGSGLPPYPWKWNELNQWQKVGVVGAGAGVLSASVGSVLGLLAMGRANGADCNEDNLCSSEGVKARDSAVKMGNVATVLVIAGGGLAAAGATLYFLAPREGSAKLALSPTPGGLSLWGTW